LTITTYSCTLLNNHSFQHSLYPDSLISNLFLIKYQLNKRKYFIEININFGEKTKYKGLIL